MSTRILLGTLIIAAILVLVGLDAGIARHAPLAGGLWMRGSLIPAVVAMLSGLGSLELAALLQRRGHAPYATWATICCLALVITPWFGPTGMLGASMLQTGHALFVVLAIAMIGTGIVAVAKRDVEDGLTNMAGTWLIVGYAGLLPSFLTILRCDLPGADGAWIVLMVVLLCKVCDIGAYFVGSAIGRTKLIPKVSPNKSVEGLFGGIAASCTVALLFWWLHHRAQSAPGASAEEVSTVGAFLTGVPATIGRLTVAQTVVFAALIAIVGQCGDLVESVFKRSAGAKDSAVLLPGFGGILDMIDSPLLAAPVAWFLLSVAWPAV